MVCEHKLVLNILMIFAQYFHLLSIISGLSYPYLQATASLHTHEVSVYIHIGILIYTYFGNDWNFRNIESSWCRYYGTYMCCSNRQLHRVQENHSFSFPSASLMGYYAVEQGGLVLDLSGNSCFPRFLRNINTVPG